MNTKLTERAVSIALETAVNAMITLTILTLTLLASTEFVLSVRMIAAHAFAAAAIQIICALSSTPHRQSGLQGSPHLESDRQIKARCERQIHDELRILSAAVITTALFATIFCTIKALPV